MTALKIWYVRRKAKIRGPFSYSVLVKLAKVGRLRPVDEISDNKQDWAQASSHNELFLSEATDDLLLKDEERSGVDRRQDNLAGNEQVDKEQASVLSHKQRERNDRRKPESNETIHRRKERTLLLNALRADRVEVQFPRLAIGLSVILIVVLGVVLTPSSDDVALPDCAAPARPGVNWDRCQFKDFHATQADLSGATIRNARMIKADLVSANLIESNISYSDLMGAKLTHVQLDNAILKGTNLRSSNLRSASLRSADLSYADLRDADLDNADLTQTLLHQAIWLDGRICAKGSIGSCQ